MTDGRPKPNRRVLVVDDEPNVRLTLKEALEPLGYEIMLAGSGPEAEALAADPAVELVLLDLKMPGIDGLQVLEHVERERPGLRVIIITAHGTVDSAVRSMKHGALDVVQKPFSLQLIRDLVREHMDVAGRSQRAESDYEAHVNAARDLVRERRFETAREHLERALAENDTRPEAYNLLGVVAYALGHRVEGQKHWRVALTHDPAYAPAQRNLTRSTRGATASGPLDLGG
jgi:DNA-binding NtrC family response regulator